MGNSEEPAAIEVEDLQRLRSEGKALSVLDVRESWELAICRLDPCLHVPLATLPARFGELPRELPLIVVCHHGIRSAQAVAWLRAKGFDNAVNLTGGIDSWARRIDRSMGTY
jgi:rhodanese-related sulfurtransferase